VGHDLRGVLHACGLEELAYRPSVGPSRRLGDRLVDEGSGALRVKPPRWSFPAAEDFRRQSFTG
jgi:hypothetical protein